MVLKDVMLRFGILYFRRVNLSFKVRLTLVFFARVCETRNYHRKTVCLFTFLLGFTCHEQGASSLILAPQHQLLISGGKKGDINIFDVRQRQQRHRFQAHESAIKCLALDPHEEFFVSGAGDGDIKVIIFVVCKNTNTNIYCNSY